MCSKFHFPHLYVVEPFSWTKTLCSLLHWWPDASRHPVPGSLALNTYPLPLEPHSCCCEYLLVLQTLYANFLLQSYRRIKNLLGSKKKKSNKALVLHNEEIKYIKNVWICPTTCVPHRGVWRFGAELKGKLQDSWAPQGVGVPLSPYTSVCHINITIWDIYAKMWERSENSGLQKKIRD